MVQLERPALTAVFEPPGPATTLVCAPAGFGKTTLVRQAVATHPHEWLSIDAGALGSEVAAAVEKAVADLGGDGVLVVDGITSSEALRAIEPLLGGLPAGVRLIVTSRARPTDELARRLALGEATLISEDDLDFTLDEAVALVAVLAGRDVPVDRVEPVVDELGGWVAGLAAVARGWQRATSDAAMAQRLRSSLEVLDDYLLGEILGPFDDDVRALVTELGHLPVLAPELGDGLRGRDDTASLLNRFRIGGGMVTPGENDGWFAVHDALRGALRRRVHDVDAGRRTEVDDVAAAWYVANGEPILAARLYADAGRWEDVRRTAVDHIAVLMRRGQVPLLTSVLRSAPLDVFQADQVNLVQYAFFEMTSGNVSRALQLLHEMERFATPRTKFAANLVRSTAGVYLTDPRPAMLAGETALQQLPDVAEEMAGSQKYYGAGATPEHYRVMLGGHLLIGGALTGEWRRVVHLRTEVPAEVVAQIATQALVGAFGNRATNLALAGELVDAEREAQRGLAAAVEGDLFVEPATAPARYALGEAKRAGGDWRGALDDLATARDKAAANGRVLLGAIATASLAHAHLDGGEVDQADAVLGNVEAGLFDRARTVAGSLAAASARVSFARGDSDGALRALQRTRPTPMTASECMVVALLVQDFELAESLVAHWPADPTVDNRVRRGLALAALGTAVGRSEGTEGFGRAVALAAKHGLVQPLVRLAEPLAPLLRAHARKGASAGARLCQEVLSSAPPAPLPGRQLAVMRLLEEGLTFPEIAEELHISVSMVKKHTRAIYKSLGAANRAEAVLAWSGGVSRR